MREVRGMSERYIEFEAPCCFSIRTCRDTAHYIILVKPPRILKIIEPVRCERGIRKKYKFYPSENVVLVSYYRSN